MGAAIAGYKYLDARYRLSLDLHHISLFIAVQIVGKIKERRDLVNVFYILEDWAQKAPDRAFLIYAGKSWTYRQSYEQVLKYGSWLKEKFGVQKNDIVALDCMNSDVFVWVWFGLWSIGAKPAFINYNLIGGPLLHCLKTSGTKIVLVDEEVYGTWDEDTRTKVAGPDVRENGGLVEVVRLTPEVIAEIDLTIGKREPNSARSGEVIKGMASLIYTSGTTGMPKPAVMSWGKCTVSAPVAGKILGITKDDVFYTPMPLYHSSAAVLGVCLILANGATIAVGRRFHRRHFWDEVRSTNATIIQYVGETCRYLLSVPPSPRDKDHNLRMAFGNGLRPDVWPVFKERFGIKTILEFYSATEAPGALFNQSSNTFDIGAVGVGGKLRDVLLGSTLLVAEMDYETDQPKRHPTTGFCIPAKTGEPGELLFKLKEKDIDAGFQGYWKNDGASKKKILRNVLTKGDAYFSSGDLMRHDSEGRWFFSDRIGDTFRWKSENVSTAEVAEVVGQMRQYLEEANVYGVELPGFDGRAGCAALVLSPEQHSTFASTGHVDEKVLQGLASHSLQNLPRYAVPIFLRVLKDENANRTGTQKQQKAGLRNEGVDPSKVRSSGDVLFWLPPGDSSYRPFGEAEWKKLKGGGLKL